MPTSTRFRDSVEENDPSPEDDNTFSSDDGFENAGTQASSADQSVRADVVAFEEKSEEENEASMAENPFESKASKVLFDALDNLQSCNAKQYISTPQLVIVGAQSAGKSSLLQSLTGIPFPVGKGCCTRFATRIVSRRSEAGSPNQVRISITPPDFPVEHFDYAPNDSYKDFIRCPKSITVTDFAKIVEEVSKKYLGINPGKGKGNKNFATEVLKVEISGPNRSFFSILDIPGVIANAYKVRETELAGVENLVTKYMQQPDNIVICVADATVDLETQSIFQMARQHVDQARLIGVYTKCDKTDNKDAIVAVVNGKKDDDIGQLTEHGWFIVRNKTKKDDDDPNFDLDKSEAELFGHAPWSKVISTRKGSAKLKKYLGRLLSDKIQATFPQILSSLSDQLKTARLSIGNLGVPRATRPLKQAYLADIARKYQTRARAALETPWHLDNEESRARIIVKEANEEFSEKMTLEGHIYEFESRDIETEGYLAMLQGIIYKSEQAENLQKERSTSTEELFEKIKNEVNICSSTGLPGMVHPDVVHRLYKYQTQKWCTMAEDHITSVASAISTVAEHILNSVCPASGSTADLHWQLLLVLRDFHDGALQRSLLALRTYCRGDQSKLLQTTDPVFSLNLQRLRTLRMAASVRTAHTISAENLPIEPLSRLLYDQCHHSSLENTVNEVHDILKVYYECSRQSFIRHIVNTIVEDFVIDTSGTLLGLSLDYIYGLGDADVDRLGEESRDIVQERELLMDHIQTLEKAEKTARDAMVEAKRLR